MEQMQTANARGVDRSRRWRVGLSAKIDRLVEEQSRLATAVEELTSRTLASSDAKPRSAKKAAATGERATP